MGEKELPFAEEVSIEAHFSKPQLVYEAVNAADNIVTIADATKPDLPLVYVNRGFEALTGYTAAEVLGRNCRFLQNGDDRQPDLDTLRTAIREGKPARVKLRNYRKNGEMFWNELHLTPVHDEAGTLTHFIGVQNDVTELYEAQEREQFLRAELGNLMAFVAVLSPEGTVLEVDEGVLHRAELSAEDILGSHLADTPWWDGSEAAQARLYKAIRGASRGERYRFDAEMRLPSEATVATVDLTVAPRFSDKDAVPQLIVTGLDITERKRASEALDEAQAQLEAQVEMLQRKEEALQELNTQLYQGVFHDALTGLPNRSLFLNRLGQAVKRRDRGDRGSFAVLFLDFDRFKLVNDSLGHAVGDALLIAISKRLQTCVRPADTVARLGGDEFTILLDGTSDPAQAKTVAERITHAFKRPLIVAGHELYTSASIGLVTHTAHYQRAEDVVRDADIAMYKAKAQGRGIYQVFDTSMRREVVAQMRLEQELRTALQEGALQVAYQPIFSAYGATLTGFEALVRWPHPTRGLLLPSGFLPVAEETGLIAELDRTVWLEACKQAQHWQQSAPAPFSLSVNLSSHHFARPALVTELADILEQTQLEPSRLIVEVSESVIIDRIASVRDLLEELKGLGVKLHVDNFGTGYASLAYLHRLPFDALKIDRSFISSMTSNEENAELVRVILSMADNLGLEVIAEGVETSAQFALLASLHCSHMQGFHLAKPVVSEHVQAFLSARGDASALEA